MAYGEASNDYFDDEAYRSEHVTDHTIQLTNLNQGPSIITKPNGPMRTVTPVKAKKDLGYQPAPVVKDVVVKNIGIASALVEFTVRMRPK